VKGKPLSSKRFFVPDFCGFFSCRRGETTVTRPNFYEQPTESELMDRAMKALRGRQAAIGPLPREAPRQDAPGASAFEEFLAVREARRKRSLQSCHHFSLYERPRHAPPEDTGAFVPQASAGIENDRNLTDGARRCARKLMEMAYRSNRDGRALDVTVTYLAKALGKCRRSVQRYLRLLEREGYVRVEVVAAGRSRMCYGLAVELLAPLFPRHQRQKWPESRRNPDATQESQIHRFKGLKGKNTRHVPVERWAMRCMDGVFRALMKTIPPIAAS
jgi:hypothetical protein